MIEFIEKKKGIERDELLFMTDDEVEHIYNVTYFYMRKLQSSIIIPTLLKYKVGIISLFSPLFTGSKTPTLKFRWSKELS